jgi:hypothetical protein
LGGIKCHDNEIPLLLFPRSHLPNKPNLLILNRFREKFVNSIEKQFQEMLIMILMLKSIDTIKIDAQNMEFSDLKLTENRLIISILKNITNHIRLKKGKIT